MKSILGILLAVFILSACNTKKEATEESSTQTEINLENLVEVQIPVHGMTCEGCENAVKKSISSLEGIAEVSASHLDSIAIVKFDKTLATEGAIKGKIADAGYTVVE